MTEPIHAVYGTPPDSLVDTPPQAVQCSPRVPGATLLDGLARASLAAIVVQAPQNVVERRRVLALAVRALRPGGRLVALAPNKRGGARLAEEVRLLGCVAVTARPKSHHQIVTAELPERLSYLDEADLDDAVMAGSPRLLPDLGLWSQPGLFSWDHVDPGSALLVAHLPCLEGAGADLGCGIGVLARAVRQAGGAGHLTLVDIDRRALDCAEKNVPQGAGIATLWADVRAGRAPLPRGLDFVVCNPPFHDGGAEDRALGQAFIRAAAGMLRPGGTLWLTANRHLPYEAPLREAFDTVEPLAEDGGYKIFAARLAAKAAKSAASVHKRKPGVRA